MFGAFFVFISNIIVSVLYLMWCCFVFHVFGVLVHSCAVFGAVLFCVSVYLVLWCILGGYLCCICAFFVFVSNIIVFVLYLVWCVLASAAQSSPAVTLSL